MKNLLKFQIKGMRCVSCAVRIEKAIASVEGVKHAKVNFVNEKAEADVDFVDQEIIQNIENAIDSEGYKGAYVSEKVPAVKEGHGHMSHGVVPDYLDLIIAIAFTLPLVIHMFGVPISPSIQLVFASIVQLWAGRQFYLNAWKSLIRFRSNMDLLVTLGTSAAYGYSAVSVIVGAPDLYFEAASVVITLVLLGRFIENRVKKSANAAVRSLMKLTPATAFVEQDGVYVEILSHDVKTGDHVMVKAWQRIPVDGVITQGSSEVDESMITGESVPVVKHQGDRVIGGTTNTSGVLYFQATTVGGQSTLARLITLVESAQTSHPPIQKFVDKVSSVFVPTVLGISLLTFIGWLALGGGIQQAMLAAVSVLVIACPCALGLATPTAIVVAMGAAARKGILIKDLESMEALRTVDLIVFDKTGTLTKGEFSLTLAKPLGDKSEEEIIRLSASLQKGSEHPIAKAFLKKAGGKLENVEEFVSIPGKGIQGKINGQYYLLGSSEMLEEHGIKLPEHRQSDQTVSYLASDGQLLGVFYLTDLPRKGAREALRALKEMGVKTVMLTGDKKETAELIGEKVGIGEVVAHLKPKDKVNYVKAQEENHHSVAMVGDGINDAPALAAAQVGFAMGSGTDVAMDAAPITLMRPALELIPESFRLSGKTFRVIQENLFWAFIFNVIGIGFAAFGQLSPEIAGGAMAASSVMVVLNSLRLKRI